MDEVTRYYYLFLTAIALNDYETAENYKRFVKQNAGTTWYGNAVNNDFIPERKPDNYPGFVMNMEKLNKPDKIDKSRLKYALIGVLIVLLFYLLPRL